MMPSHRSVEIADVFEDSLEPETPDGTTVGKESDDPPSVGTSLVLSSTFPISAVST